MVPPLFRERRGAGRRRGVEKDLWLEMTMGSNDQDQEA
jgi:hypothetical protein